MLKVDENLIAKIFKLVIAETWTSEKIPQSWKDGLMLEMELGKEQTGFRT
jgi:hypothetical protein